METLGKTPETGQEKLKEDLKAAILQRVSGNECSYEELRRLAANLQLPIASEIRNKQRELTDRLNAQIKEHGVGNLVISEADLEELYTYFPQEDLSVPRFYRSSNAGTVKLNVAGKHEVRLRISSEPGSIYIDYIDAIGQLTPVVETQSQEEKAIDNTRENINGLVQAVLDTYRNPSHITRTRVEKIVEGLVVAGENNTWLTAHNADLGIAQPGHPFDITIRKIQSNNPRNFGYQLESKRSPGDTHPKTWGYRLISKS